MSARSDLAALIEQSAPATWTVYPYPARLRTFEDPAKPVAIVIEQRSITTGRFSPDNDTIPAEVELAVWVVVDGIRGDDVADVEDVLEEAVETMVRILEPLPDHVWNGTAERGAWDEQKPAYTFTITAGGRITQED